MLVRSQRSEIGRLGAARCRPLAARDCIEQASLACVDRLRLQMWPKNGPISQRQPPKFGHTLRKHRQNRGTVMARVVRRTDFATDSVLPCRPRSQPRPRRNVPP
jgi:hypothetical protein